MLTSFDRCVHACLNTLGRVNKMGLRVILVLMVKNEERILKRCLEAALPHVDGVLLSDTGSSDATIAVAKGLLEGSSIPLDVRVEEWSDFGTNRTRSIQAARVFCQKQCWPLEATFCLVLDADMTLHASEGLRDYLRGLPLASGICVKQINGVLEYYNTRFMRLSDPWLCEGVTHEYWTGGGASLNLPDSIAWIMDLGDGGCKEGKFERDERLLVEGLTKAPTCARYMFYLAQTYACLNRDEEAIEWYKRRAQAGGWIEEVWYSHLMIARLLLKTKDVANAEEWVESAFRLQPDRLEGLVSMVTYFRTNYQYALAWKYLERAEKIKKPDGARLFLEIDAYTHKLDYERSFLYYYIKPGAMADGAMLCLKYEGPMELPAMSNLMCYTHSLGYSIMKRLEFPAPEHFVPCNVSVDETGERLCVRTVSYQIDADGSYIMRNGVVETRNFSAKWDRVNLTWRDWSELKPDGASESAWRRSDLIRGLEDIRIRGNAFTATTREFSYTDKHRIAHGNLSTLAFAPVIPPRGETDCEKNWVPISDHEVIYEWHPLSIGTIEPCSSGGPSKLIITREHPTPRWFRHLRGSAPPIELEDGFWTLVHIVCPRKPRVYLHAWIVLSKLDYAPISYTPPFCIKHWGIEYCIGATVSLDKTNFGLFVSVWDQESWYCETSIADLRQDLRCL